MKPHKPFLVRDRFKGFKPEEKNDTNSTTAEAIHFLNESWNLRLLQEQITAELFFGIAPSSYCTVIPNGIILEDAIFDELDSPPCEHEPIDIGFITPKMICKKCDEDLNEN